MYVLIENVHIHCNDRFGSKYTHELCDKQTTAQMHGYQQNEFRGAKTTVSCYTCQLELFGVSCLLDNKMYFHHRYVGVLTDRFVIVFILVPRNAHVSD